MSVFMTSCRVFALLLLSGGLAHAEGRYVDLLDSHQPTGFTNRIVHHPDSGFSARVGMRVHLELSTLMGEPVVYCPAIWWLEEIYDQRRADAVVDLHKIGPDQLPEQIVGELDLYKAPLVVRLKTGQLLRCDPGVLRQAASVEPSFTVPASPSWSRLLFWDDSEQPRYIPAEQAKAIWRDLIKNQQHSGYAVRDARLADTARINLWALARHKAQASMEALTRRQQQATGSQARDALDSAIAELGKRFRQAFNKSMTMPSRFSRERRLVSNDCQKEAAAGLNALGDASQASEAWRQCVAPKAASQDQANRRLTLAELEHVADIPIDRSEYWVVKRLSSGVVVQEYDELHFLARDGQRRRLEGRLDNRARVSYANVIESDDGGFWLYASGASLVHFDKAGRRTGSRGLSTTQSQMIQSDREYLIALEPGPRGSVLAVYVSTSNRPNDAQLRIDQVSGGSIRNIAVTRLGETPIDPELTVFAEGDSSYCWLEAKLQYARRSNSERKEQRYCLRYQAGSAEWLPIDAPLQAAMDQQEQQRSAQFARRAARLKYPAWLNGERLGHQNGVYYASSYKPRDGDQGLDGEHGIYLRTPSHEYLLPYEFSSRERVRAVDGQGECLATSIGSTARFFCRSQ